MLEDLEHLSLLETFDLLAQGFYHLQLLPFNQEEFLISPIFWHSIYFEHQFRQFTISKNNHYIIYIYKILDFELFTINILPFHQTIDQSHFSKHSYYFLE